jgi:hypothetical protein
MFDAMSQIDDRLIDRCLSRKNNVSALHTNNIFKRWVPITVSLLIIIASFLAIIISYHYKQEPALSSENALKIGFDHKSSGVQIAVLTDRAKINVGESLPVSIYSVCNSNDDIAPASITAKIVMSYSRIDPENMIETVKTIDDGTTPGYTWNGSFEQMETTNVTIPASVFTKADQRALTQDSSDTDGVIVWALEVNKIYPDGSKSMEQDSVALYYKIDENEVYLKPSEETMEIAKTAVEKLQLGVVFLPGLDVHKSAIGVYNDTAKWVAPELLTLETKEDAAIALIKLYEDMLEEYRSCNLERFYENLSFGNNPTGDILTEHNKIVRLQVTRMVIEALLALDCYYDLLDTYNIQRMTDDFNEYLIIDNYYTSKYFNDVSPETMFEMYRRGDLL